MSKGSRQRTPTDQQTFDSEYDRIFGKPKVKDQAHFIVCTDIKHKPTVLDKPATTR